ncbi:FAD assembly factor SdhE [Meridianimarinicoccus sp. RP-17]|uniref:FAD assembly factor SdhE n=1 Tax=Meridianimarinicoccus zhengii TaxID=2056810 RepID=UPI000DAEB603|nr:succinate dehydrogenase assembly factor 2 [Phycocomes zhengii]
MSDPVRDPLRETGGGADEPRETRLKRLRMRSIRRGIKEMDLILGAFAAEELAKLPTAGLDLYDALLTENDHDLYGWVSGQTPTPPEYLDLVSLIAAHQSNIARN